MARVKKRAEATEKAQGPKQKAQDRRLGTGDSGLITADTPIMELVINHPQAVSVLMDYGFHCIGCQLSAYESIGAGAAAHGMDEKQVEKLVSEINAMIKKK